MCGCYKYSSTFGKILFALRKKKIVPKIKKIQANSIQWWCVSMFWKECKTQIFWHRLLSVIYYIHVMLLNTQRKSKQTTTAKIRKKIETEIKIGKIFTFHFYNTFALILIDLKLQVEILLARKRMWKKLC